MNDKTKLFLRFLKEKQLYHIYFSYFYTKKEISYRKLHNLGIDFQTFCHNTPIFHLVISAFSFSITKEGSDYWYQKHFEWERYYLDIKKS